MNGLKALERKAERLRAFVNARDMIVADVKARRAADLEALRARIVDAQRTSADFVAAREELLRAAGWKDDEAAAAVAEAKRLREEAAAVPIGDEAVAAAVRAFDAAVDRWQAELAAVQDGRLRRKIAEYEKVARRIDTKHADAERAVAGGGAKAVDIAYGGGLSTKYGTPSKAPTAPLKIVAEPLRVTNVLGAVRRAADTLGASRRATGADGVDDGR